MRIHTIVKRIVVLGTFGSVKGYNTNLNLKIFAEFYTSFENCFLKLSEDKQNLVFN